MERGRGPHLLVVQVVALHAALLGVDQLLPELPHLSLQGLVAVSLALEELFQLPDLEKPVAQGGDSGHKRFRASRVSNLCLQRPQSGFASDRAPHRPHRLDDRHGLYHRLRLGPLGGGAGRRRPSGVFGLLGEGGFPRPGVAPIRFREPVCPPGALVTPGETEDTGARDRRRLPGRGAYLLAPQAPVPRHGGRASTGSAGSASASASARAAGA